MRAFVLILAVACFAMSASADDPHVGYIFPAGARQGDTVEVTVGGQFLKGATDLYVTGGGIGAEVTGYSKELTRQEINRLRNRREKLVQTLDEKEGDERRKAEAELQEIKDTFVAQGFDAEGKNRKRRPDPKKQPNAQLAEQVTLELRVAPDTALGLHELRLVTPRGLSNPFLFQVGDLPEQQEKEPNDLEPAKDHRLAFPAVMNGQILPGDVDLFRFAARKGQALTFAADARSLVPYLADAVPGWFQATLTLYDEEGREVAFVDDHQFDPDPVLVFEAPADGDYTLEIRDAIYRGREDFVYRMALSEEPPPAPGERERGRVRSWAASCEEVQEQEPNDEATTAEAVADPALVRGRIERPGDWDVYRVNAHAGETLIAEVWGRRMGSPIDAVLRVTDGKGRQLAFNDDHPDRGSGLATHHADPYLAFDVPEAGDYFVHVGDIQQGGGADYAYRLRIGPPRPDFELRVVPASVNIPMGSSAPVTVHALRKDGFDGPIRITLAEASAGFRLDGGVISPGQEKVRMTLTADRSGPEAPVPVKLAGHAVIEGQNVTRPAVPAEDMMQAFLWRHLVPARAWVVTVTQPGRLPLHMAQPGGERLRIPAGGTAEVRLRGGRKPNSVSRAGFDLDEAPDGLSVEDTAYADQGREARVAIHADAETVKPGDRGNLILTALARGGGKQRRVLGLAPAIPYEIIEP